MKLEVGKKYRGLINGCIIEVLGTKKDEDGDLYYQIVAQYNGIKMEMTKSANLMEHLSIEEIKNEPQ